MNTLIILKAVICIFLYLGMFFAFGLLLPQKVRGSKLYQIIPLGFVMYFAIFELIALPMKLLKFQLKILTAAWFGICLFVIIFDLVCRRSDCLQILRSHFKNSTKGHKITTLLFLAFASGVALFLAMNTEHISEYDASYYIGLPASSVYSNTIELMDPNSGIMQKEPDHFYIMNTYVNHSAVVYQAIGLPSLTEQKFTMTFVLSFLFIMVLYGIGLSLFSNKKPYALLFAFLAVLVLLNCYGLSNTSQYFAYRTYEGKAIASYLIPSLIFLFVLTIYHKTEAIYGWTALFFTAACCMTFCNTSLILIPAMISLYLLPYILLKKDNWRMVKHYVIVIIPCLIYFGLYKLI